MSNGDVLKIEPTVVPHWYELLLVIPVINIYYTL